MHPERFLPLTPVVFEIALALAAGERHGYEIMQDVERRTDGKVSLHPGTLYRALGRLEEMGLLKSRSEDPRIAARENRPRRRFYTLTASGELAVRAAMEEARAATRLKRWGRRPATA